MAKRVTVIDIGSNSVRMVIYEKSSRFAFHLLHESKSKVRISQDAYLNNNNLQEAPMQRTIDALREFLSISKSFKSTKILCVATSALRDAPNSDIFLKRVKQEIKLKIKIISGEKEAYFGAIACANLLKSQQNALSIDIGGGSTELSIIDGKNITKTISLELGTVRLKELFFDKNDIDGAIKYIDSKLSKLNDKSIKTIIGIGGTMRAVSSAIMIKQQYPLQKLHAYEYDGSIFVDFLSDILKADNTKLKKLGIKSDRFDIIKPGALIVLRIIQKISLKSVITSGVGVREGVYLSDLLRNSKDKLPHNYNTSVRYLIDAHIKDTTFSNQLNKLAKNIFDITHKHFGIDTKYRQDFAIAAKLYPIGNSIHFYSKHKHSYYLVQNALEYGFSHKQIILIATLLRYAKRKLPSDEHTKKYFELLPEKKTLNTLSYLLSLTIILLSHRPRDIDFDIEFNNNTLRVKSPKKLYLLRESLNKLQGVEDFRVKISAP